MSESPSGGESDTEGFRECLLPPDILDPPAESEKSLSMEDRGISSLRRMFATFSAMASDWVSKNRIESSSFWDMSTPLDVDPEEVPVVEEAAGNCNMSGFLDL